ncbi:MAG TPA: SUMF1/EgtB/PvdO family nonheme iron enzyme [Chitinophagaceae bacterium]|nr:SUMF1/EgtB/PvdO family nonheme iron enzyme [Chitinophagaceae bacterium]
MTLRLLTPCMLLFAGSAVLAQQPDSSFHTYDQAMPESAVHFRMVAIPGGTFTMGSPDTEPGRDADEGPRRTFVISPFWMGACEVTHDEFDLFFKDVTLSQNLSTDAVTRPSPQYIDLTWDMGRAGGYPVNSMQQRTAIMYCRWLYRKTGLFYRLPTEAEWEYACRAGTGTAYFFGNDTAGLSRYAWYAGNSGGTYHQVARLQPNAFGLYDMLGNVAEWVLDQYDPDYFSRMADGQRDPVRLPTSRHPHLLKGGSYSDPAPELRCANRISWRPEWNRRDPQIPKSKWWLTDAPFAGFRLVRPLNPPSPEEAEKFFTLYLDN